MFKKIFAVLVICALTTSVVSALDFNFSGSLG